MRCALLAAPLVLATSLLGSAPAPAQVQVSTVHLRVLLERSGKPVRKAQVVTTVVPDTTYATPLERTTDAKGTVSLLVQNNTELRAQVLRYSTCGNLAKADRKQPTRAYPVQQVLATGVVSKNHCGKQTVTPTPGELTLFVRPLHWWERR